MGMITAPLCERRSMFSIKIMDNGVSRRQRTNFLFSFRVTAAARVIKLSAIPQAILERVEAEQGRITIASHGLDPEANGEERSSSEKTFFTGAAKSSIVKPVSWAKTDFPHLESARYFSPGQFLMK